ncbi:motility-associated protein [Hippea maritima]|uniref:Chemotaxis MotA protein n=1 Tax=Hippea maritima (strain ATCC 700847 / DSM 10411 / MH2) TaxID=760142 RepID=F2LUU0_HIPMA|nr:motility-associated protein [Hippea maritima]AEA33545.1 chemotaxis MotA protein [Hippea maritima DSM 10411]
MNAGGIVLTLLAVVGAFVYEGGNPAVLIQIGEYIVLFGAFFGMLLSNASPSALKGAFGVILGIAKPDPYNKKNYLELLKIVYDLSTKVRKDGILSLEAVVDDPESSPILQDAAFFLKNKEARSLLIDALRNIVTGIEVEKLEEMLDTNIESIEKEAMAPAKMVGTLAESMPGMGIVAAVMGVILTMGALGGSILVIGEHIAAALTGTFLGLLMCYGIFGPMAKYAEFKTEDMVAYLNALKTGIIYIAKGDAPIIAMEAVRESIPPLARPEFDEAESFVKGK